jgi:N utilization substance protein B
VTSPADKRRHARLAAVQALYQAEMTGETEASVARQFALHRLGQPLEEMELDPDREFFTVLVNGVGNRREQLDEKLGALLPPGRAVSRLEVVLRAILRAAAYELTALGDVPARVVLKEYVDIAGDFFGGGEAALANGLLDKLARVERAEEMTTPYGGR